MARQTIDTSILVRLFAQDDDVQFATAAGLFSSSDVVLLPTVLLETEWVLRSRYGFDRYRIHTLFNAVLDARNVFCRERQVIVLALDAYVRGMDFADALHVCLTEHGGDFITFDRRLVRLAKQYLEGARVELAP